MACGWAVVGPGTWQAIVAPSQPTFLEIKHEQLKQFLLRVLWGREEEEATGTRFWGLFRHTTWGLLSRQAAWEDWSGGDKTRSTDTVWTLLSSFFPKNTMSWGAGAQRDGKSSWDNSVCGSKIGSCLRPFNGFVETLYLEEPRYMNSEKQHLPDWTKKCKHSKKKKKKLW